MLIAKGVNFFLLAALPTLENFLCKTARNLKDERPRPGRLLANRLVPMAVQKELLLCCATSIAQHQLHPNK